MELFNYISAAVSIILAISATHLLSALRNVIAPQRRDWLVVCWYAYLAYLHLLTWWFLFAAHNVARWNLGSFSIAMAVPALLYLTVYTLLPEAPGTVLSWKEHFQKIRRWFYLFYALFIAASEARETVLLGRPLFAVAMVFYPITYLNVTAGAIWRNRRLQIVVLSIELLITLLVSVERFYAER